MSQRPPLVLVGVGGARGDDHEEKRRAERSERRRRAARSTDHLHATTAERSLLHPETRIVSPERQSARPLVLMHET